MSKDDPSSVGSIVVVRTPRALVFDLDGTLVDSTRDIADALNAALVEVDRPTHAISEIAHMIGDGARMLVVRGLGEGQAHLVDRTLAAFQRAYAARPCVHTALLPGASEALALDRPRALLTNKPRALTELVLRALGIEGAFDAIFAGGDGPLKPAPDGLFSIAATLDVPVADVWMIGDGAQDVLAGRAAGCFTVAVSPRAEAIAAAPDRVLASLAELPALVALDTPSAFGEGRGGEV
jgi:phosphoglycolate phosphatase